MAITEAGIQISVMAAMSTGRDNMVELLDAYRAKKDAHLLESPGKEKDVLDSGEAGVLEGIRVHLKGQDERARELFFDALRELARVYINDKLAAHLDLDPDEVAQQRDDWVSFLESKYVTSTRVPVEPTGAMTFGSYVESRLGKDAESSDLIGGELTRRGRRIRQGLIAAMLLWTAFMVIWTFNVWAARECAEVDPADHTPEPLPDLPSAWDFFDWQTMGPAAATTFNFAFEVSKRGVAKVVAVPGFLRGTRAVTAIARTFGFVSVETVKSAESAARYAVHLTKLPGTCSGILKVADAFAFFALTGGRAEQIVKFVVWGGLTKIIVDLAYGGAAIVPTRTVKPTPRESLPIAARACETCGDDASYECDGCGDVAYCSAPCHQEDWAMSHRISCSRRHV